MSEMQCPQCGRTLTVETGAAFCPYCGGSLQAPAAKPENTAVQALLTRAEAADDPVKKHALLTEALALDPESLAVAEELLYLGRLYERNPHAADFSVIKCYLLNPYLEPTAVSPEKRDAMRRELFDHPDLDRCLRLCGDRTAFLTRYLTRLSAQYIDLFLHGSSQHMHRFFGFSMDSRAPKLLAVPAARMLAAMRDDGALTPEQRSLLMHAFYAAFNTQLNGDVQWLRQEMQARGVTLD